MENAEQISPEVPEHLLEISVWIERYAKGDIPLDKYQFHLDRWYEKNREVIKENDLSTLFLVCCLSN
jgi:hypothetical protein